MNKRTYVLLILAVVLGGIYVNSFTDWVHPPRIQILQSSRPIRNPRWAGEVYPIAFSLDGRYELTLVKVVSVTALATNKRAAPLWHLVTKSNSLPTKGFLYGQRIPGMVPAVTNARPGRLQPLVTYRLYVQAGRAKGETEFRVQPVLKAE